MDITMEDKIRITINKKEEFIGNNTTDKELLQSRGLTMAAVWVNGSQLLKAQYDTFVLHEGDEVKLLRIMAGG